MAISNTGLTVLEHVLRRGGLGLVLKNAEIDALAADSITSALWLANGTQGPDIYRRRPIFRPSNATGTADYVRYGTTVTSAGALSVDRNWSDATLGDEDIFVLEEGLHPSLLIEAMNHALELCYFSTSEPLSTKPLGTVADAGFNATGTGSFTLPGAGTLSKVDTAESERVFPGMLNSGRLINASSGDYFYQRFHVSEGEQIHAFTLSRLDSGTNVQVRLWDQTNDAQIGSTIAHAQEQWQWTRMVTEQVPDDCTTVEVRMGGEGSSDDTNWNAICFYRVRNKRVILDTKWDTEFKMPALYYTQLRYRGHSVDTNVYDGFSTDLIEIPMSDYNFEFARPGANPYAIQFHNDHWYQYPIYIQGKRAHADIEGPFTLALTETTTADMDLFESAVRVCLFEDERAASRLSQASSRLQHARDDFNAAKAQFLQRGPSATRDPNWAYRGAMP